MGKKEYTGKELYQIAAVFFDITSRKTCNVFDGKGMPFCKSFSDLDEPTKRQTVDGLKSRIDREGLDGYLERKRPQVGDETTNSIISALRKKGLL